MAVDKYLKVSGGAHKEVAFLQSSAGAGDAGKAVALDSTGRLSESMMPVGIGADTKDMVASEIIAAGSWVNVWDDAGAFKIRKADATTDGKYVDGFILEGVSLGGTVMVYFEGPNTQVTGMTPGSVFLQTTAGAGGATIPSASGNVVQRIGVAVSATEVNFERGIPVVLA